MRRVQRRKKPVDYLLPFLVLISVGVIGVLGFQLWSNWNAQGKADAYFYVVEGKAKVLPFAQTDWDTAFSGTKLLLGDSLKTSLSGLIVTEFFNGTVIRMAEDSAMSLVDLSKSSDTERIIVSLDNGKIWVNGQKSAGVREAVYEVRTRNLMVKATGTVFEVESGLADTIRVMDGEVKVDVYVPVGESERVADTISVGVGQQITIDEAAIRVFVNNEKPSVLMAIDDAFKSSKWYLWNISEDTNPTDYALGGTSDVYETVNDLSATPDSMDLEGETVTDDLTAEEDDSVNNGAIGSPKILEPKTLTTTTGKLLLSGTVDEGTTKVVVESSALGASDRYTLSQFKQGSTTWSYNVSEQYGNIKAGENTFKVYAYDANGEESEPAKIVITYEKEKVVITDELSTPKVMTFNGSSSSDVTTGVVKIVGEVKGAEKVIINDYQLSQFKPGDTSFVYYANEEGGNLKEGLNEYEVYAVDPDGNKSPITTFTINYTKSSAQSDATTTSEPAAASSSPSQPDYGF